MTDGSTPAVPKLLCITPAPAIDRTAKVEHIDFDTVLRPTDVRALAGGKGVNAARTARRLGAAVTTSGIGGGHAGRWIVEQLEREGLSPRFATAAAESRTTYVTIDDSGRSVMVYERPGEATDTEYEAFLGLLADELLPGCDRAIVAGSAPSGLGTNGYAAIVTTARDGGRPLLIDVSGPNLAPALVAGPDIVKIGRTEAIDSGVVSASADGRTAAVALVDAGARLGIITDGAATVVAADAETVWRVEVPRIDAVNPVGSGDAFNAGLSIALARGDDVPAALQAGVAAGAANAMTLTGGDLDPIVARELAAAATVTSSRR